MLAQGTPSWGHLPAKQGAEPSWERQVPALSMRVHGRQHARGAGRGWWGENTLCASSSVTMNLNHKLAWKHRLLASPAAWCTGENSSGHHSACSAASLCAQQTPQPARSRPLRALWEACVCSRAAATLLLCSLEAELSSSASLFLASVQAIKEIWLQL